ncbi:hypothetical protein ABH931_002846 [Streptacidiphilus sp. MAP12-33]|uniref:hypothetical protein n=1 Tax=Streptacidiphilus sp. MAP12-33 TaxID=3156266 RepID=UPI0035163B6D
MGDAARGRLPAGAALAWAVQPGTLAALVVLVVNDHVLKQLCPGPVSGKLSDLAGMLVAPPLLALFLASVCGRASDRQALAAVVATGVGFTLVKTSAEGARWASALWSLTGLTTRLRSDPTDLVALPLLAVAWLVWRRARRRPVGAGALRRVRALLLVPLLVAGVVATSPGEFPVPQVAADGGRIVEFSVDGTSGIPALRPGTRIGGYWTTDGGRTWTRARAPLPAGLLAATRACAPEQPHHCFQVGLPGPPQVRETLDGGAHWRVAWALSGGRVLYRARGELDGTLGLSLGLPRFDGQISSTSVVVRAGPDGDTVMVADQADGLVVRDPSGRWRRIAAPDCRSDCSPPLTGFGRYVELEILLALAWGVALLIWSRYLVWWWRDGRGSGSAVLVRVVLAALLVAGLEWCAFDGFGDFTLALDLLVLVCGLLALSAVGEPEGYPAEPPGTGVRCAAALGGSALVIAPYLGWSAGVPDSFAVASLLGAAALPVSAAGMAALTSARVRRDRSGPLTPRSGPRRSDASAAG